MRYPAGETAEKHQRILREASKLFRERGVAGVSVSEVMKAAGLTHGAFYAHFPSKDALACASLDEALAGTVASIDVGARGDAGDRGAKADYVARYLSPAHRDDRALGCPLAALGAEVAREPALRRTFTVGLRRFVAEAASRFAWKRQPEPERQALALLSTMVGALVLARAVDDDEFSDLILEAARTHLAG